MVDPHMVFDLRDDLRRGLLPWVLIPIVVIADCAIVLDLEIAPTPSPFGCAMALLALAGVVWLLRSRSEVAAGWVLTLGVIAVIVGSAVVLPGSGATHFMVYPLVAGAIVLGPGSSLVLAVIASAALALTHHHVASTTPFFPSTALQILALLSLAYLMYIAQRPEHSLLTWAWEGYEQTRRRLEQARDRQLELKQALEDLALANNQTIRLNEMLKSAREAVDEARRAKEEFVAKVSHELRTPLNMIIGFSDMILETPHVYSRRLPPALLADVAAIRRNSEHLASLVDDVLDLAEADMGSAHLVPKWTTVSGIVAEATEAVAVLFEKKGLALHMDVEPGLPLVYCDRTRIRQVLLNLLSNAGRFTEKGGAHVEARLENGSIRVTVSDTGPGMNPANLDRLFEPFQQEDESTRRRYGGSGLGLAISKRFVEMHGGRIWIESGVGAGTRVSFCLPVQQPSTSDAPRRWFSPYEEYTPRTRRSLAPRLRPRPRVVVLEQGAALRHLVEHYLEEVEVAATSSPRNAPAAIENNAAIAVLVNAASATMSSEFADAVAELSVNIPVMTCWVPERRAAISQAGAQDYLVKPIQRADLIDSLRTTCPGARTILLADDDTEARQLFARMLASAEEGYTVLQATDGDAALMMLRERRPDVLLLDLVMPNCDGFMVLEAKSADPAIRDIPTIIISAKDPQREPIISKALVVSRPNGLSARDLMDAIQAVTRALRPRVDAQAQIETPVASQVCE